MVKVINQRLLTMIILMIGSHDPRLFDPVRSYRVTRKNTRMMLQCFCWHLPLRDIFRDDVRSSASMLWQELGWPMVAIVC